MLLDDSNGLCLCMVVHCSFFLWSELKVYRYMLLLLHLICVWTIKSHGHAMLIWAKVPWLMFQSCRKIVVEDVEIKDGEDSVHIRRLVFASNSNLIQSEARLRIGPGDTSAVPSDRQDSNPNGAEVAKIDWGVLCMDYHIHILAGLISGQHLIILYLTHTLLKSYSTWLIPFSTQAWVPFIDVNIVHYHRIWRACVCIIILPI